jgi:type II secretory pathway component PulF
MPSFTYTARNAEGRTVSGVLTADNQQQVLRSLDERFFFGQVREEASRAGKKEVKGRSPFLSQFADLLARSSLRSLDDSQTSNAVFKRLCRWEDPAVRRRLKTPQCVQSAARVDDPGG